MHRHLAFALLLAVSSSALAGHRFHATALAAGFNDARAAGVVALAPIGGNSTSTVRNYRDDLVNFAESRSIVRGEPSNEGSITVSEVTILDLSIGNRVHVDRIVARVTARHRTNADEAEISFEGSAIEGLRIDGVPAEVTLDLAWFDQRATFASLQAAFVSTRFGLTTCSAAGVAQCGVGVTGQAIHIPDFGTLFLGEAMIQHGKRQIQMLRFEQAQARQGGARPARVVTNDDDPPPPRRTMVFGSADSNGSEIFP